MKRFVTGLLLVSLLLGAFACGKATESIPYPTPAPTPTPTPAPMPPVVINMPPTESSKGIFSDGESVPAPVITIQTPSPAPAPTPIADSGQSWSGERMIIRTGNLALVVVDVAQSIEQITKLASNYQGFVVNSNTWRNGERLMGNISIRVAAEHFDAAMGALRGMAVEVNSESTSGQDVTEEYVDLSSKLRNLEAAEAQLLKLMAQAGEVSDILQVQRELTNTRGQIEQTKGRMQYLEQSSSMSLIQVSLEQSKLNVTFTASGKTVKVGQNIRFEPSIGGGISPYSYEWDFGDAKTSTDVAPVHAYKSAGSYNITLKVTDDRGQTASQERNNYIDVLPGWSAGNTVTSAWHGLIALGHVAVDILIWIVYLIPLWVIIGVIVYFAWWRRRRKKA